MNEIQIHDDPKLVVDQLDCTVDVNQNVYPRASVAKRKEAVEALENAFPVRGVWEHFGAGLEDE